MLVIRAEPNPDIFAHQLCQDCIVGEGQRVWPHLCADVVERKRPPKPADLLPIFLPLLFPLLISSFDPRQFTTQKQYHVVKYIARLHEANLPAGIRLICIIFIFIFIFIFISRSSGPPRSSASQPLAVYDKVVDRDAECV